MQANPVFWMTDVYGPRLARSPSYRQATEWAKSKLEAFELENVALEVWGEFGAGWREPVHLGAR